MKKILSIAVIFIVIFSMFSILSPNVKAEPVEIIIDTEVWGTEFTAYPPGGYWVHVHDHDVFRTRAYAGNFWYTLCGEEGTGEPLYYGLWQTSLLHSGMYEVFVWIPDPDPFEYDGRVYTPTQSAIYQIYHKDGVAYKTVNQRLRTGGWYSVGTFTFDTTASVILNDRTGEPYCSTMIAFDAIKFVRKNQPPTCSLYADPKSGNVPLTVTFYMSASDPDGSIDAWVLDVDGDGNADYEGYGKPPSTQTHIYTTAGSYSVILGVIDDEGETAFAFETVNVYDFSISASPTSLIIEQGSSDTSTITITSIGGFNQPVQLTVSGAPSGVTTTLTPSQVTPPAGGTATSTLTVSVDTTATAGSYTLTVTGTSDALTHSTYISLEIPPPEYRTLKVYSSPSGVTFTADGVSHTTPWSETYSEGTSVNLVMPLTHMVGEAKYKWDMWSDGEPSRSRTVVMDTDITLTAYYTGPYYQLTVASSPITGIPFTIDGASKTTIYTEWLLQGSYTVEMPQTYSGYTWSHWLEDGDTNRIKTFTLSGTTTWTAVYTPPPEPDFTISASPNSLTIPRDNADTSEITITSLNGFDQQVQLSVSGVAPGVTATLVPDTVTPPPDGSTTSTLIVAVDSTATLGSYTLTVTGTSDTLGRSTNIFLEIINQPPNKPAEVSQYRSDGVTVIPEGGTTPESTVVFKATVSDPDGDSVRLEIELRQIGEPFTGEPTPETISDFVPSGTEVTITRSGLVNADYHWQYRAKDSNGATSDWKEFGTAGNIDFKVYAQADLEVSIDWISNDFPLEGEPVTIRVIVTNKGNAQSKLGSITFYQNVSYQQPISYSLLFTLSSKQLEPILPGESKTFEFIWDAVEIVNTDPTKRLVIEAHSPGDADFKNNKVYVDLNINDTSGFDVGKNAFSFRNWGALENWWPIIKDYLPEPVARAVYPLTEHVGYCYSMAAASAVYYKHPERKPVQKETFDMLKEEVASEIRTYWIDQIPFLPEYAGHVIFGTNLREEYAKIVENLKKDQPVIMAIGFKDEGKLKQHHAVMVLNIYEVSEDIKNIVAYDNEYPGMAVIFTFDLKNNIASSPIYGDLKAVCVDVPGPYPLTAAKRMINNFYQSLRNAWKRIISFKCPINVTITDQFGRTISEVENQIPDASFEYFETIDMKIFYLPVNLTYYVQLIATDYGNSTIAQITPTESIYETAFSQATFDLTSETVAEFDLLPYDANYTLKVDENGDCVIDYELIPEVETLTTEYDIGIIEIVPSETVATLGDTLLINVTVMNYGAYTETFNITIYANETIITVQTITLANGTFTTYTFTWNTLGFALGNYTISAYANPLPGETNTADNKNVDGVVQILPLSMFYTFSIVWGEETFVVSVESNSTVSNFYFDQAMKEIGFNVAGEAGTLGFCNVTIPKQLLRGEPWTVLVDAQPATFTQTENDTHTMLYFTYGHSTHRIQIIGTWVIGPPPDTTPPLIDTPFQEPEPDKVMPDQAVTVSVNVTDMESGVESVILSYATNGGAAWTNLTMLYNATTMLYQAAIPAFPSGTTVCYKITAYDNANNHAINDNAGQYYCYTVSAPVPPLSVSISPLSASILVGQSVTFTSTVSGGITPYTYQWYLNGNPVSGATSDTWAFTPTTSGIYYVYLEVTDDTGNTAQSEPARITASTVPVGGYAFPIDTHTYTTTKPLAPYIALIIILIVTFAMIRRKTPRKAK